MNTKNRKQTTVKYFRYCTHTIISAIAATALLIPCASAAYTANVKADALNMRKTPGGEIIDSLRNGTSVSVLDDSSEWFKISVNGKEGYVSGTYLVKTATAAPAGTTTQTPATKTPAPATQTPATQTAAPAATAETSTGKIKCDSSVNLRSQPNTSSQVLGSLPNGTAITVIGKTDNWLKVTVIGKTGFVRSDLVELSAAAPATSTAPAATPSTTPASDASAVTATPADTIDPETQAAPAATEPVVKTQTPDASASNEVTSGTGRISCDSAVNLRQQANTNSAVLTSLASGTTFTITSKSGDWYQVLVNGKAGFIRSDLVELTDGEPAKDEDTISDEVLNASKIIKPSSNAVSYMGSSAERMNVLSYAAQFLGTPYVYAGSTPAGFDCSGFVCYVFSHTVGQLPRIAQSQFNATTYVSREDLLPGDLVFFGSSQYSISHVGIYVGDDQFIHSPHTGDVVKYDTLSGSYGGRFQGGGRVIFDQAAMDQQDASLADAEEDTTDITDVSEDDTTVTTE